MHARAKATIAAAAIALASSAYAAEKTREQGAHQHGHGSFEMAIEKTTVSITLRIPGDDIVGFEHPPGNDKEKAAIETAKKKLADALTLYGIPKDAACKVEDTNVHTHGYKPDDDHAGHKHDDKPAKAGEAKEGEKHDHDHKHGSFHAKYTLACAKPNAITSLNFKFFGTFPRSQELEIVAVSEKSQVKAEATPKAPTVSLRGLW
jgi:Protein of unknown function (DUF2796)